MTAKLPTSQPEYRSTTGSKIPTSSSRASLPPVAPPPLSIAPVKRHHRLRWTLLSLAGLVLILLITGGWIVYRAIALVNTQKLDGTNKKLSFFQQLTHIVTHQDNPLQGEGDDRINILLLGIGGPGHDGPYLTDTMIVASYKPSTKEVAMLSIPRDLVVNIPGYDFRKINNVLSIGREQDYPGGGDALVLKVVGDTLDLPIHYYARVDFAGFAEVIDRLGGISVNVERSFVDREYPTTNYGYQTIRFHRGSQEMDGEAALKFARSRHGSNSEGSDFARAARQQKIIVATRDKALSLGTLLNPKKISDILGALGKHHQTNMEAWEAIRLAKLVGDIDGRAIVNKVLDDSINGLLQAETGLAGAFVLVPRDRNYEDIRFLANNIFLIGQAEREGATVLVANATDQTGLAETANRSLAAFGLQTAKPMTIREVAVAQTLVIDIVRGRYDRTTQLVGLYRRARGTVTLNQWATDTGDATLAERVATEGTNVNSNAGSNTNNNADSIDIVLILGQDQTATKSVTTVPYFKPRS